LPPSNIRSIVAGMTSEVRLDCPPNSGHLRLWGRCAGDWFALIEWQEQCQDYRVYGGEHRGLMFCTGWIASHHVARITGQDYGQVPRIDLPGDPRHWPTRLRLGVQSPNADHYFGLLNGGPVSPPAGVEWLRGHGSIYG
jgi:hypothetical protein